MPLTKQQQHLWEQYIADENDRIRAVLMESLSRFIDSLSHVPQEQWYDWVFELAREVVDERSSFPIRFPLFERIIFPVLHKGYINDTPNCARLLAGFSQLIYKSEKCMETLGKDNYPEHALLEKAIKLDSSDHRARKKLIRILA